MRNHSHSYIQIWNWPNIIALHWTLIFVILVTHQEPDQTDHISLSVSLNCLRSNSIDTYLTSLYYRVTFCNRPCIYTHTDDRRLSLGCGWFDGRIWTGINVLTSNMNIGWAVNCWVKHTATLRYLSMTIPLVVIPNYPEFPEYYSMEKD